MKKKKSNALVWVAILGIGGYLLYKYFTGQGGYAGGGGSGGGCASSDGICPGIVPSAPSTGGGDGMPGLPSALRPISPGAQLSPVAPRGSIFQQLSAPGVKYNEPRNTIIVAPNVKSGQITVIPLQAIRTLPAPYRKPIAQPPLKIVNVFGFPVVPRLLKATVTVAPVQGRGAYYKPGGM